MRKALKMAGVAVAVAATFGLGALTGGAAAQAQGAGKAPQACLDYIDHSTELVLQLSGVIEASGSMADAGFTTRAVERYTDRIDAATPKVETLTDKLTTEEQQCRGGK